jgi:hypothetical protein
MQETAEQYRQRMFVLVDGKDPVKLQAAAPARLAKLLKGVSPAKARKRPAPEKWSIAEIVAHMADTEVVFGYLIRGIVGEPGTRIDVLIKTRGWRRCTTTSATSKNPSPSIARFAKPTWRCSSR